MRATLALWQLLLVSGVLGLDVQLLSHANRAVVTGGAVEPAFDPSASADSLFAVGVMDAVALFNIAVDAGEAYARPEIECEGCEGVATPLIDRSAETFGAEGTTGDMGAAGQEDDLDLRVTYGCTSTSPKRVRITVTIPRRHNASDDSESVSFSWAKTCAVDIAHTGVLVSYEKEAVISGGAVAPDWQTESPRREIAGDVKRAVFTLATVNGSFEWSKPRVDITGAGFGFSIVGSASGPGYTVSDLPRELVITFESCESESTVQVTWNLSPYKDISFAFKKACQSGGMKNQEKAAGLKVTVNPVFVHFKCDRRGSATVTATLEIENVKSVNLLMQKVCFKPKTRESNSSLTLFFLLFTAFGAGCLLWYYKERHSRHTEPARHPRAYVEQP
eukprot:m51a1_g11897 hypothetical protein (390) ;mRNA; r:606999-608823